MFQNSSENYFNFFDKTVFMIKKFKIENITNFHNNLKIKNFNFKSYAQVFI